jgi:hypothetical protein
MARTAAGDAGTVARQTAARPATLTRVVVGARPFCCNVKLNFTQRAFDAQTAKR